MREGLCKHYGCRNRSRKGRHDCETCKSRKRDIKHPEKRAYKNLKISAKKRDIPFELTYEEFLEFDRQTDYVASKGRGLESLTVDRIHSFKGYSTDNIRALTLSENCAKIVEGMTDPIEPIAQAMALAAKDDNWYKYKKHAVKVLMQVEILQTQSEGGFELLPENHPDWTPF